MSDEQNSSDWPDANFDTENNSLKKTTSEKQKNTSNGNKNQNNQNGQNHKVGSLRVNSQNRRRQKVGLFLQSLQEVSPLVELAKEKSDSVDEFQFEIAKLFHKQKKLISTLSSVWSLSEDDLADVVILSKLARIISGMMLSCVVDKNESEVYIETIAKLLTKVTEDKKELGEFIDDGIVSTDILVNVKMALFSSAISLQKTLLSLGASEEEQLSVLRWHHQISVLLGKDLAFNWDKSSQFKDRETLFQQVLPHCAKLVVEIWMESFCDKLIGSKVFFDSEMIWNSLFDLNDLIIEQDMGYGNHDILNISWLKKNIGDDLISRVKLLTCFGFEEFQKEIIQGFYLKKLENTAIKAWNNASNKTIALIQTKLEKMTQYEIEEWQEKEGAKPMSFSLYQSELDDLLLLDNSIYKSVLLDYKKIEQSAKKQLATLWGLSDAVCKLKSK
jgi:hypothetical protein